MLNEGLESIQKLQEEVAAAKEENVQLRKENKEWEARHREAESNSNRLVQDLDRAVLQQQGEAKLQAMTIVAAETLCRDTESEAASKLQVEVAQRKACQEELASAQHELREAEATAAASLEKLHGEALSLRAENDELHARLRAMEKSLHSIGTAAEGAGLAGIGATVGKLSRIERLEKKHDRSRSRASVAQGPKFR